MDVEGVEESVSSWDEFERVIERETETGDERGYDIPFVGDVLNAFQESEDDDGIGGVRERRGTVLKSFNAKHGDLKELVRILEGYVDGELEELPHEAVTYFESLKPVMNSCQRLLDMETAYLTEDEQDVLQEDIRAAEDIKEKLEWRVQYGEVIEDINPDIENIKEEVIDIVKRSCDGVYDETALNGDWYSLWVVKRLSGEKTAENVSQRDCINACRVCPGTLNADLIDDTVSERLLSELEGIENELEGVIPGDKTQIPDRIAELRGTVDMLCEVLTEYNSVLADRHIITTVQQGRNVKRSVLEMINSEVNDGERVTVSKTGFDVSSVPGGSAGCVRVIDDGYDDKLRDVMSDLQMVTASRVLRASETGKSREAVRLANEVEHLIEGIESSVDSGGVISDLEVEITALREDVDERLREESYLHSDVKQVLLRECDDVLTDVVTVEKRMAGKITARDRERIGELKSVVESLRDDVKTHNVGFVEEKRDAYSNMFSDMGEEQVSLNKQQEYAVFRNDEHNKVNAGAGTGKTFSVACRVQYLLCEGYRQRDIIALTFLREAAETMQNRLDRIFNVNDVAMQTLHSFGKEVLDEFDDESFQLEGEPRKAELNRLLHDVIKNESGEKEAFEAFETRYKERVCDLDPGVQENVVKEYENRPHYTVHGEEIENTVPEVQEAHSRISKWLAERGIEYEYRAFPECESLQGIEPTRSDVYLPEFALPEHKICIEYYPSRDVREQQEWYEEKTPPEDIEQWFEGTSWDVVIVTDSNSIEDTLTAGLKNTGVGVAQTLSYRDYINNAYEEIVVTRGILDELGDFVQLGKSNTVSAEAAKANVAACEPEVRLFTSIAGEVLEAYQQRYDSIGAYDYTDMIVEATELLKSERLPDSLRFNHVIVDEFQDLSRVQIEFIQTLLEVNNATLFAVGDDWQSIYGFKGARPEYFVEFDEYFAPASETRLEENYRCPPSVVDAGNALIEENDLRTVKEVEAAKDTDSKPRVHAVAGGDRYKYVNNAAVKIEQIVLESIKCDGRDPDEIVVIVRNKEGTTLPNRIRGRIMSHGIPTGRDGIEIKTAHQMKGMEQKHVIVANVGNLKKDSFPTAERDKELLEGVNTDTGSHIEEERRLFYVALTRAKERIDLQIEADETPMFIENIKDHIVLGENTDDGDVHVTGRVTSSLILEGDESVKQVGALETQAGYELEFAIMQKSDISPVKEDATYKVTGASIGRYNAKTRVLIDEECIVKQAETKPRTK